MSEGETVEREPTEEKLPAAAQVDRAVVHGALREILNEIPGFQRLMERGIQPPPPPIRGTAESSGTQIVPPPLSKDVA